MRLCILQGLFVAAETILNTIVLPPAIDDAGGAGSANDDYTQVQSTASLDEVTCENSHERFFQTTMPFTALSLC